MDLPACEHLALTLSGGVLHVSIDRPEKRNALARQTVEELLRCIEFADDEAAVRVLVLRGSGGNFCAGGDLKDMASARSAAADGEDDPLVEISRGFGALCARYASADVALISVLEGAVMGGGFGLACVSDVCIAAPDARFGLPETRLGVLPAQIAPFLIERLGFGAARRLAVEGGSVGADEALRLGLVDVVSADPDAALGDSLDRILRCAPGALAATKQLLRDARLAEPAALVDRAARAFAAAARGEEGVEGTLAFIEKRRPRWTPGD